MQLNLEYKFLLLVHTKDDQPKNQVVKSGLYGEYARKSDIDSEILD